VGGVRHPTLRIVRETVNVDAFFLSSTSDFSVEVKCLISKLADILSVLQNNGVVSNIITTAKAIN